MAVGQTTYQPFLWLLPALVYIYIFIYIYIYISTYAYSKNKVTFQSDLDLETQGVDMTKAAAFLQKLGSGLHAASPPIKLSYDAGNTPVAGVTAMDRWVSMGIYRYRKRNS